MLIHVCTLLFKTLPAAWVVSISTQTTSYGSLPIVLRPLKRQFLIHILSPFYFPKFLQQYSKCLVEASLTMHYLHSTNGGTGDTTHVKPVTIVNS